MSRVDFYILPEGSGVERFACGVASKAWKQGHRVHIHTASEQNANHIDDLLWTFRDISFIPHDLINKVSQDKSPVTIGFGTDCPEESQVIINLDNGIPDFIDDFDRIVEIVGGSENNKQLARQRYRHYRDGDYDIHDHKIETAE